MTSSIKPNQLDPLNAPLKDLKTTAEKLGLNISDLYAQIDIKENPYTGNSISLHSDSLPYRLHGKGSKRLMSIAIQSELTKQGGIVLVDELEQGLEPDRIINLVRILKETTNGQVFITTHSLNVVLEAEWKNLFVINKNAKSLCVVDKELDSCRRSNPQAFFAKKIICCEGKTEVGFIRAVDTWIRKKYHTSLSAKGVVEIDAKGGNQMYTIAMKLKKLGFETCVFADDDIPKAMRKVKEETEREGIHMFLCESGNCLEKQIIGDLPWSGIDTIINCPQEDFPYKHINIPDELRDRIETASTESEKDEIRKEIADLSIKKGNEWFKQIPGGEFLGRVFCEAFDDVKDDASMKQNIQSLLHWCDITNDGLEGIYKL